VGSVKSVDAERYRWLTGQCDLVLALTVTGRPSFLTPRCMRSLAPLAMAVWNPTFDVDSDSSEMAPRRGRRSPL
jgi:hypothetical protein